MNDSAKDRRRWLHTYIDDLRRAPGTQPLCREREEKLAARIREGDLTARDELVQANLRFVVKVARQYENRGLPLSDLISVGNMGLLTAAERFDSSRGPMFISYAIWWIRQAVLEAIAEQSRTIRLPPKKIDLLNNIWRLLDRLDSPGSPDRIMDELAEKLEVSVLEIRETLRMGRPTQSLDEPLRGDARVCLLDLLADSDQVLPDREATRASDRELLEHVLACLNAKEQYVIRRFFGLGGNEVLNLAQIGERLGLTRERVRQIRNQALSKLRRPSCIRALQSLRS